MILTQYSLVKEESNVIIRNLGVKKVLADNGDAIGVREYIMLRDIFYLGNGARLTGLRKINQCVD